jgi:hypothetical protein
MVMTFSTPETGLVSGDVEACMIGSYSTHEGMTFTFFGCDSINTNP